MITRLFFILLFAFPSILFSQEDGEPTPHAVNMDFNLPTAITNYSFKSLTSGLIDLNLGYSYHFEKPHLVAGVGVKYGYWGIESVNFPNDIVTGRVEILAPMLQLGYRSILNEKTFLNIEFNGGISRIITTSNKRPDRFSQTATIISPKVSLYLKASDLLYFGINLGYSYLGAEFGPENLGMTNFPAANDSHNQGEYQYFSVGLGFHAIIPSFK